MVPEIAPIKVKSLKQQFLDQFEQLILSGHFSIGEKLPPERELAKTLGVSRPVVHEGLVDLAAKGMVNIVPRKGTRVNDFRREGSAGLLLSLLTRGDSSLRPDILVSVLDMRMLFETELSRLAAAHRDETGLRELAAVIKEEETFPSHPWQGEALADLDYRFHHTISLLSNNIVYPLMMNSFKPLYLNILCRFYRERIDLDEIFSMHHEIFSAIKVQDADRAEAVMTQLLRFSSERLNVILEEDRSDVRG